jgi:5-(carboxyamino)imidazole ribonucleotide mutase
MPNAATPPVAIIMGSRSDWPTMKGAADALTSLGVAYEAKVISAHRTTLQRARRLPVSR